MRTTEGTHGAGTTTRHTTESTTAGDGRAGARGESGTTLTTSALESFRDELTDLWGDLERLVAAVDDAAMIDLSHRLERHVCAMPDSADRLRELANDLMALMAGWQHLGHEERIVLATAMAYLAEADDAVPDHLPGGLEDDDRVVGAAVRAVLRPRRRVA
ncbi:hypothetical protein [Arsenicicoccus bolidensis]|uniref:Uncharacterized protein n=1 Tax=Arsenicicoccus bolidensis TaxID=229480 RepID=A0ABS9Q5P3_9MICO|nr:hypothetical protein [Arsenicicoccus bolidensis]MCG7322423.1 hypothetical protein [Arsenicicoccus bolidensis]